MIIEKRFVASCICCRQQFVLFEYNGMPGAQYSDHQCADGKASYGTRPFDPTEQVD